MVQVAYVQQDSTKILSVFHIQEDGTVCCVTPVSYQEGMVSFPQSHWSVYAIVEEASFPFTDVAEDAWYYDAVRYAVEHGITNGTTIFPQAPCTQAQVVTFLYDFLNQ